MSLEKKNLTQIESIFLIHSLYTGSVDQAKNYLFYQTILHHWHILERDTEFFHPCGIHRI